jgi:hypothetical protein
MGQDEPSEDLFAARHGLRAVVPVLIEPERLALQRHQPRHGRGQIGDNARAVDERHHY